MEYYTGSKFALEGITDSLRYTAAQFNISVVRCLLQNIFHVKNRTAIVTAQVMLYPQPLSIFHPLTIMLYELLLQEVLICCIIGLHIFIHDVHLFCRGLQCPSTSISHMANTFQTNVNAGPVKSAFLERFGHEESGGKGTRSINTIE